MNIQYIATAFFFLALVHTFAVSLFAKVSYRFREGSVSRAFFHLLSEVEVVFGFWAFLFLLVWTLIEGTDAVIHYQQSLNMTEPLFIFCIMIIAATRPIMNISRKFILICSSLLSRFIKVDLVLLQFFTLLTLGPLLGSLITEPAAITITALLLLRMLDGNKIDNDLLHKITALLFVNISVGGALTHFAAPPILVVARIWDWGLVDVFTVLGEPALIAVLLNGLLFTILFKDKLKSGLKVISVENHSMPSWVVVSHLVFLAVVVATSHYPQVFLGLFLVFMGLVSVTNSYQDQLKFKQALLVAFFLGGLIVFGSFQRWWLEPLVLSLNNSALFMGAVGLTAITDNAALTYLGSQIPNLSELSKWALVSGALAGGGLTILANAPNPVGFSILSSKFENSSLNAFKLIKAAFFPTLIAMFCFYFKIFIIAN